MIPQPWIDRFWSKVDVGDCWEWTRSKDRKGYGSVGKTYNGKPVVSSALTHRVAWEILVGPIPPGMHLDHLCRNTSCCNPDHLEVVTPKVNSVRGYSGGSKPRKTCRTAGHDLDKHGMSNGTSGYRVCGICRNARQRARAQARGGWGK